MNCPCTAGRRLRSCLLAIAEHAECGEAARALARAALALGEGDLDAATAAMDEPDDGEWWVVDWTDPEPEKIPGGRRTIAYCADYTSSLGGLGWEHPSFMQPLLMERLRPVRRVFLHDTEGTPVAAAGG